MLLFTLLTACGASDITTGATDTDPASTTPVASLSCVEAGVNGNPFTVASAMASNTADHALPADYVWSTAVPITLNGTSITVGGSGATVNGRVVTIASAGTYLISGALTDGQIVVATSDPGVVRLVLSARQSPRTLVPPSGSRRSRRG